ncbi:unnamed protein product [Linum trigynum]|uniref:Uncharacterized protein n=1 Tax=Linum trigynum TaxID=586398 RepID=A0AAV2DUR7_9ROSI
MRPASESPTLLRRRPASNSILLTKVRAARSASIAHHYGPCTSPSDQCSAYTTHLGFGLPHLKAQTLDRLHSASTLAFGFTTRSSPVSHGPTSVWPALQVLNSSPPSKPRTHPTSTFQSNRFASNLRPTKTFATRPASPPTSVPTRAPGNNHLIFYFPASRFHQSRLHACLIASRSRQMGRLKPASQSQAQQPLGPASVSPMGHQRRQTALCLSSTHQFQCKASHQAQDLLPFTSKAARLHSTRFTFCLTRRSRLRVKWAASSPLRKVKLSNRSAQLQSARSGLN